MRKLLLAVLVFIFMSCLVYPNEIWVDTDDGNNSNPGTRELPIKSPKLGVEKLGAGGGTVHINVDGFAPCYESLKPSKTIYKPSDPLIINGYNNTIFYGFDGEFQKFNPSDPPQRNYHVAGVMDCHNVIFKNFETWGGVSNAFGLDDSYPEIGLHYITLDNIIVRYGGTRGIFMGGSNISHIKILNSYVTETAYGDSYHGIYLSGGHWNGDYPPIKYITIRNTTVNYSRGRHGIQLNGRFEFVIIDNCTLFHNELAGLSLIGCRWVEVKDCLIYGNHKQGIVVYDYFDDHYWDPNDPESVKEWKRCHHSSGWMWIHHNTIVVGPTQWHKDANHNNKPGEHGCIAINNAVQKQVPDQVMGPFLVAKNALWTPGNASIVLGSQFTGYHGEADKFYMNGNMVYSDKPGNIPWVAVQGYGSYSYPFLEEKCGDRFAGNLVEDPEFNQIPVYEFIDLTEPPYYFDWSKHRSSADLFSPKCRRLGIGKRKW